MSYRLSKLMLDLESDHLVLQRKVGTDVLNLNILGMLSCLERDQTYQERTHAHADWSRNLSRAGLHPGAP